jgi:hypothetical protein
MVGAGFIYLPRAEAAWLQGDLAVCRAEARGMLDLPPTPDVQTERSIWWLT